jgi:hypothetical protein
VRQEGAQQELQVGHGGISEAKRSVRGPGGLHKGGRGALLIKSKICFSFLILFLLLKLLK